MTLLKKHKFYILIVLFFAGIGYFVLTHKLTAPISANPSFEPDIYFAQVIQAGGVGSDIYTNRAYYIGNGTAHQEGWPNYLDKNTYAPVSFNSAFYLMYLMCKKGYKATVMPKETTGGAPWSAGEDKNGNSFGFSIEIKNQIRNELTLKCQKP